MRVIKTHIRKCSEDNQENRARKLNRAFFGTLAGDNSADMVKLFK